MHRPLLLQHINDGCTLSPCIHQQLQWQLRLQAEFVTVKRALEQHLKFMLQLVTRRQGHKVVLALATYFHRFSVQHRRPQIRML